MMELYFAPLACSLASRITIYEGGLEARFIEVGLQAKQLKTGEDFRPVRKRGARLALRSGMRNRAIYTPGQQVCSIGGIGSR